MRATLLLVGACLLAIPACEREDILVAEVEPAASVPVPPLGQCHRSDQCADDFYCEHLGCDQPIGTCRPRPFPCDLGPPVCGCDGVTYPGECIRRASGATLDHPGKCKRHTWE